MRALLTIVLFWGMQQAWAQTPIAKPDWISDPKTGCKVWNANPKPNEAVSWSGACENGFAAGQGLLQWSLDGKPNGSAEGNFRNGKLNGKGTYTFANGNRYQGDFLDGNFHGKGIFTLPSGNRYEGDFVNDKFSGKGIYTFPN